jgi:hypothetical protein
MKNKKRKNIIHAPIKLENGAEFRLSSFEITDSPIQDASIPKAFKQQTQAILDLIANDPKRAVEKLLVLKDQYPDVPKVYNYLAAAYSRAGNQKLARDITVENYKNNPGYLYAKINYAQICLNEGNFYKIPDIFEGKLDLKILYPDRNKFHISEFAGFTGVLCAYFSCIGNKQTAEFLYKSLTEIAPEEAIVPYTYRFLHPSLFRKLMNYLGRRIHKAEFVLVQREAQNNNSDVEV